MKLLKKPAAVLVLLLGLLSVFGSAPPAEAQVVVLGGYCCDAYAVHRCWLGQLGPVGTACFCLGQGYGWTCR